MEGGGTVHRPRREIKRRIPTGRGGRDGSSCGGFIANGCLWWPEPALEALGFHGLCFVQRMRERERERERVACRGERERVACRGERERVACREAWKVAVACACCTVIFFEGGRGLCTVIFVGVFLHRLLLFQMFIIVACIVVRYSWNRHEKSIK